MYRSPHARHRNYRYYRENKNLIKSHQKEYKNSHAPLIKRRRRPKREVTGYKMSYRFKMYAINEDSEEDEITESSD